MKTEIGVGTTPTISFEIPIDPTSISKFQVVFNANYSTVLVKNKSDFTFEQKLGSTTAWIASTVLTQEDSLSFPLNSTGKCQLKVKLSDGTVMTSRIMEYVTTDLLSKETI